MKALKYLSLVLIFALVASCQKAPVYPDYPVITFKSFTSYGPDSAHIIVNFTDGNGQMGNGTSNDLTGPPTIYYQWIIDTNHSGHFFPFYTIAGKNDTSFVISFYDIPNITPTGKNKALSGEIIYMLSGTPVAPWYALLPTGTVLEFRIWAIDRNGIKSNVVTTTPYTIPN